MPAANLPRIVDAAYIADRLTLEAEMFRGLLRTGYLTPEDASRLTEELGRFCLEAAAVVKHDGGTAPASEVVTIQPKCDEGFERLPAEVLFWG